MNHELGGFKADHLKNLVNILRLIALNHNFIISKIIVVLDLKSMGQLLISSGIMGGTGRPDL